MIVVLLTLSAVLMATVLTGLSFARIERAGSVIAGHDFEVLSVAADELRGETGALAAAVSARARR